ncbi:hypothetical protein [Sulfurospirillum cavolei]|uniref:hypothetical protein n=1 Tax=Sulfurospirillum cavolei TaxID=366522 RepID=UPI000764B05A|nr:hypothetical protein [Sulfurospirillum cavolei]
MIRSSTNAVTASYATPSKSVKVTDPQTGVEHIAYYGYAIKRIIETDINVWVYAGISANV